MPIYEYRCTKCEEETEALQSISAKPLKKCNKCGGKLEKLISQNAFHLKGSGWYKTDYAPKDTKNEKKSPDEKGKEDKKKETKPSSDGKKEPKKKAESKSAA